MALWSSLYYKQMAVCEIIDIVLSEQGNDPYLQYSLKSMVKVAPRIDNVFIKL